MTARSKVATKIVTLLCLAASLAMTILLLAPQPVEGQRGVTARVYITQHKLPSGGTEKGLIAFMRKNGTKRLMESDEPQITDRKWSAEMVTQFNRPPNDLEFKVLFYDVTDSAEQFVQDLSTYISDRAQRTFVQRLRLRRVRRGERGFQPNRRYELRVVLRQTEVGRHRFELIGEAEQRDSTVTFSDDETH